MDHRFTFVLVLVAPFCGGQGLRCVQGEACRTEDGQLKGRLVHNISYCCKAPSDHVDMTQITPGNVTCQCTTMAQAAAAYADRTMGERTCHWGPACDGITESLPVTGRNDTFCCLGDMEYVHTRHFGAEHIVCRCRGSLLPDENPHRYFPPETGNASSSGELCYYNAECDDSPSLRCDSDVTTFCCYGSRGIETLNDPGTNSTRCTCTNDFMGARCTVDPPFPVENNSSEGMQCRSGDGCTGMPAAFTCSHGNSVFCCPHRGLNLTVVDDVISSCTCLSAGHQCNVTFTSSRGSTLSSALHWRSWLGMGAFVSVVLAALS